MNLINTVTRNRRTADIAGACVGVVLIVGFVVGVVIPLAQQRDAKHLLQDEIADGHRRSGLVAKKTGATLGKLTRVRSHLEQSPVRLQPKTAWNARRAKVINLVNESGLDIAESRSQPMNEGIQFNVIPMSLSGTGTYPQCSMFLAALSEEVRDVEVVTVSISGSPDRPSVPTRFEFNLAWYSSAVDSNELAMAIDP